MPKSRTLKVVAGIAASFTAPRRHDSLLLEKKIISFEMQSYACCVVGNVCRIRNSDCCLSLNG